MPYFTAMDAVTSSEILAAHSWIYSHRLRTFFVFSLELNDKRL
jgi:hypothetical protein